MLITLATVDAPRTLVRVGVPSIAAGTLVIVVLANHRSLLLACSPFPLPVSDLVGGGVYGLSSIDAVSVCLLHLLALYIDGRRGVVAS